MIDAWINRVALVVVVNRFSRVSEEDGVTVLTLRLKHLDREVLNRAKIHVGHIGPAGGDYVRRMGSRLGPAGRFDVPHQLQCRPLYPAVERFEVSRAAQRPGLFA